MSPIVMNQPILPAPAFPPAIRVLLCTIFAIFIAVRIPNIFLHGRLWAEEGTIFFQYAWENDWYHALLHPYGGYLNLIANAGALLAERLVRLEDAPYVTTTIALIFQICPAILLVNSGASWLRPRWAVLAALLIIATPPVSQEVWLQTLHSQLHLALCAGIILATPAEGPRWLSWFRIGVLVLGPLCGPGAIVFVPFFLLRARTERSGPRWREAAALTLASALQMTLFYSTDAERVYRLEPNLLACIMVVRHVLIPLLGHLGALSPAGRLAAMYQDGRANFWVPLAVLIAFAGVTFMALRRWREAPAWLLLPGAALAVVSYYGAIGSGPNLLMVDFGERYSFVPQALFSLSLLAFATTRPILFGAPCVLAVIWIIAVGCRDYFTPPPEIFADGPDWQHEVALWHEDHRHRLIVWPGGQWVIDLSKPQS